MAASRSLVLCLAVAAVLAAGVDSARPRRQVHLPGVYPYYSPVPVEDDGSYWPGKYPDDPVAAPVAPVVPAVYPYAAPVPAYSAPVPAYAPAPYHGGDDGSYFPGKYGPEDPK